MTLAIRTQAQRLLDRLDESECISPDNSKRIRQRLEETDEVDAIVFECTLGGMPGSWDLALRVKTERLKSHFNAHPTAGKHAAGFIALDPQRCPTAWVEWDTSQSQSSLPSLFAQFRRDVPLETLCADLSDTLGSAQSTARIRAWMSALPPGAHARHVGKMLARSDDEIRVVIGGMQLPELIELLEERALVKGELLREALAPIGFHGGRAHLAVGFNPELLPRIGVEMVLPWAQMAPIARRLAAAGQWTAEEAELLAFWPEFCRVPAGSRPWPTPFGAHLKWVFEEEKAIVRKLYLHIESERP